KFGAYLRDLREHNTSLNQADAAKSLSLKPAELNYYEQGTRVPSDPLLINLAHLYHVPTAEVLERAYWPQLILLPLIAIVDPEQLSRDFIEELERGLEEKERLEITQHIQELLSRRTAIEQR
ncbi:helix-turn-helix transcriptional regulator, partial [Chloroflexota bacterium]